MSPLTDSVVVAQAEAAGEADSSWPERIVVGVDASPEARLALERALELAARASSTVVVVHAVGLLEGADYRPHLEVERMVADANATVHCAAELIAKPRAEVGPPAAAILRVTDRVGGDLIVVGRRGESAAWPLGSTSESVLAATDVPVLVVPSDRRDKR